MGTVFDLVVAVGLLGLMRARDAVEGDRKLRQEEVFVPFNLPPLTQQEQAIGKSAIAAAEAIVASYGSEHVTRNVAVSGSRHEN
jgi:hypothetical protein